MKSFSLKIKLYLKAQDWTPPSTTLIINTTYGTIKSEKVIRTYDKWTNCCSPTSLRLFKEEKVIKYV